MSAIGLELPFYMSQAFEEQGHTLERLGGLKRRLPPFFKLKQAWKKQTCGQRESPRFNITAAHHYSEQIAQNLAHSNTEVVISPLVNPIAYLDCKQPIVLWTDALYASLIGFYPAFSNHSASSIQHGNTITRECLDRCQLALFSSDWAARTATEIYGISQDKVKIVPFGANITQAPTKEDIPIFLKKRSPQVIKLLFVAKRWDDPRKGGDIVLKVAKALHENGHAVELHCLGRYSKKNTEALPYVRLHGFVSKHTPEGRQKIANLYASAHFLFMPSRAEACAMVFAEANAFALPCLTSHVGGISTVVKNNINGMTFGLDSSIETYCDYITNLMDNYDEYEKLALSSFNEYETRLNWKVATARATELIQKII
jgi:glycosyltransferase involved in cell wall biosynthesis